MIFELMGRFFKVFLILPILLSAHKNGDKALIQRIWRMFFLFFFCASAAQAFSILSFSEWWAGRLLRGFNMHLLEEDPSSRFAVYRMATPSAADMPRVCDLGLRKIMTLNGVPPSYERCRGMEIITVSQSAKEALTGKFLKRFDKLVQSARVGGFPIAFHCNIGSHRTGRLAAYYELRYLGEPLDEVLEKLRVRGLLNDVLHPQLEAQVRALDLYIKGKSCEEAMRSDPNRIKRKDCVQH